MMRMKGLQNHKREYISVILIAAFLICIFGLNLFAFGDYMDSDVYGDVYVAKLMWEQKTIFPENWCFGNQLYVAATPNVAALFNSLTNDMFLAMGLASCVMAVLEVLGFWYCFRAAFSKGTVWLGLLSFFTVFLCNGIGNDRYGELFWTGAAFYSCYVILLLFALGAYLRLQRRQFSFGVSAMALLTVLLSFLLGMHSLRQTMVMVLPMLCYESACVIWRKVKNQKQNVICSGYAALLSLSNLCGVFCARHLSVPRIKEYETLRFIPFSDFSEKLSSTLACVKSLVGLDDIYTHFKYGTLSLWEGLIPCVRTVSLLLLFVAFVRRYRPAEKDAQGIAAGAVLLLSLLGTMSAFWLLDMERLSKYLFPFFILIPVLVMLLYENSEREIQEKLEKVLLLLGVFSLCVTYLFPLIRANTRQSVYDEMADYIVDNGYEIVYGEWKNVGNVAGASDGKLLAGRYESFHPFLIMPHTNILDIYTEADNDRAVYIITQDMLPDALAHAEEKSAEMTLLETFEARDGVRYLYRSDRQLMYWWK